MTYNLYIVTFSARYNLLNLSIDKLTKIITAYKKGESNFTLSGKKYFLNKVQEIRIFENTHGSEEDDLIKGARNTQLLSHTAYGNSVIEPHALKVIGKEVTDDHIGDTSFGEEKVESPTKEKHGVFINIGRIGELQKINHPDFDLRKLIQLCNDMNLNFDNGSFLTVGMIGRAIIDHVPPIFGKSSFNEVVSNYAGGESFKKNMEHLNKSLRSSGDSFLHMQIRKSESLPSMEQVDFKQNMDVLLGEIVRVLRLHKGIPPNGE
jgi:hypothetical protein